MASIAGKNRDQGSIFSQEIRQRGYWRPRKQKVFSSFFFLRTSKKLTEEKNSSLIAKISSIRKRIER